MFLQIKLKIREIKRNYTSQCGDSCTAHPFHYKRRLSRIYPKGHIHAEIQKCSRRCLLKQLIAHIRVISKITLITRGVNATKKDNYADFSPYDITLYCYKRNSYKKITKFINLIIWKECLL